jgi:hypothetical protein
MFRRLLLPGLLIVLSGCASDEPKQRPGGPPPVRLFISPSGEPFRGEGGLARWFAQADADHDGAITLEEFRADAMHSFKVLDANGDGTIDGFELQAYERNIVPEIGIMSFEAGAQGGGRMRTAGTGGAGRTSGAPAGAHADPEAMLREQAQNARIPVAGRDGAARFSLLNEPQPIAAADANLDGNVTLAEWTAMTDRRFAKLDHLKAGRLTLESLLKVQPAGQKGRKGGGPPGR